LHLVFLEGGAGVGKANILWKLNKLGYDIHADGFVKRCLDHPQYPPDSAVALHEWAGGMLSAIDDARERSRAGLVRDNVVFFGRSLLSPAVYARGLPCAVYYRQVMQEVRQAHSSSMVLCRSEGYAVTQRMSGRLFDAKPAEREVRLALGEDEEAYQRSVEEAYGQLEQEGWFDAILDTSSSKLGVAALLHALDIGPAPAPEE